MDCDSLSRRSFIKVSTVLAIAASSTVLFTGLVDASPTNPFYGECNGGASCHSPAEQGQSGPRIPGVTTGLCEGGCVCVWTRVYESNQNNGGSQDERGWGRWVCGPQPEPEEPRRHCQISPCEYSPPTGGLGGDAYYCEIACTGENGYNLNGQLECDANGNILDDAILGTSPQHHCNPNLDEIT